MNRNHLLSLSLVVLALLLLLGAGVFVFWANDVSGPTARALAALQTDTAIQFSSPNGWLVFAPKSAPLSTGLVIYPGAKVDPRAYAPAARDIAAQGYLVVITPVRLNLALFDSDAATPVLAMHPEIKHWAVAGHSLGGTAAATFAASHPAVEALVLWASYPASDMTAWPGRVLSISASRDGLSTPAEVEDKRKLLPSSTRYVVVEGGNHAGFGAYGEQAGDLPATLPPAEQQAQVVAATVSLLHELSSSRMASLHPARSQ